MNWIWSKDNDPYVEFKVDFAKKSGNYALYISASFRYAAYINGAPVAFFQYADTQKYKSVDCIDITKYLKSGKNTLYVEACQTLGDFALRREMKAGLAFRIEEDGKILVQSDNRTLCRVHEHYEIGDIITPQIGYGWKYNFQNKNTAWSNAIVCQNDFCEVERPIPLLKVKKPVIGEIIAQGVFRYNGGITSAAKMQQAWMKTLNYSNMTNKSKLMSTFQNEPILFKANQGDGIFVIVDMNCEVSGYLCFLIKSDIECNCIIGWGEHLSDLRVKTECEGRNFACEYRLMKGINSFKGLLQRIGCRYLCLFVETQNIEILSLNVLEVVYPFHLKKKRFNDRLLEKIYETGRRTLLLCAHEHYEDCPWREQALYGMDSRNQMLFGYGAFGETDLPKASLRLFARTLRADGLIELCAPARTYFTIPSFSVFYILAVVELLEYKFDVEFAKELIETVENILEIFIRRTGEFGVCAFVEPQYWNFYEWAEGLDGGAFNRENDIPISVDAILTALVSKAAQGLVWLEQCLERSEKARRYTLYNEKLYEAIENFYVSEKAVYASFIRSGEKVGFHQYTQAALLYAGLVPEERRNSICKKVKNVDNLIPMTFATYSLKYDAIMDVDGDLDFCVSEICDVFGSQIYRGATTYWETLNGYKDFNEAGSLCHGWSAVACYFFDKYGVSKELG